MFEDEQFDTNECALIWDTLKTIHTDLKVWFLYFNFIFLYYWSKYYIYFYYPHICNNLEDLGLLK